MINFLLGAMFVYLAIPLLDDFLHLIQGGVEVWTAKCNLKISEYNHKIAELSKEKPSITRRIGFQSTPEEEDEEHYED